MGESFSNADISILLQNVAAILTLNGENIFRIKAFQNAASSIESYAVPLQDIWKDEQTLDNIPGVGKAIASDIQELFEHGKVKYFEELFALVPKGFFPLLQVSGIGPKTAFKLATHFKLDDEKTAIARAIEAARHDEIASMSGFSKVSQARILMSLENQSQRKEKRTLLPIALQVADDVTSYLRKNEHVQKVEPLGSLRRRAPTVGDIDIAIATTKPVEVMEYASHFPHMRKLINRGEKTMNFLHVAGLQVDVKVHDPKKWGSMLTHNTGGKLHNIHLRTLAQRKGLSLSEYGIEHNGKVATFATEEAFYDFLGLQWIPPQLREDMGEIEAAAKNKIPTLVQLTDIKGDLHMHTNLKFPTSHDMGSSTIDDLLLRAKESNYSYIGLSDHNPKRSNFTARERLKAVRERNEQIDEAVERFNRFPSPTKGEGQGEVGGGKSRTKQIKVYKGLEVDILPDGNLALEDEALELLDYVIVSLHSQFAQDRKTATERILKALSHPKATFMGHPTGRLLDSRDGVDADWDQVFDLCIEQGKWLEVNSSPDRTDLPSTLIKRAIDKGVTLIINTDSHNVDSMDLMKHGVWNAQRGWATKANVVNTTDLLSLNSK